MANLVAIVGRPNVGKSTLFNRLTQSRRAIVSDTAGTTRDRQYGKCSWGAKEFSVVDTGGWVVKSDDIFEDAIRRQVLVATEEADLVLFLVDVTTGVTDWDEDVATILRRAKLPVILVANKVDNSGEYYEAAEFYKLGLGEPQCISAATGGGSGDLLDLVIDKLPQENPETIEDEIPRFAVVGRPNAGKSSIINAFIGEDRNIVTEIAGTTRDSIYTRYDKFGFDFYLVDTAGIRKKNKVSEDLEFYSVMRSIRSIENSDVCILMIDATRGIESQDMNIFQLIQKNNKSLVVVVNKWDLVEDKSQKVIDTFEAAIRKRMAPFVDFPIIFVSAITKQRIFKVLETAKQVYLNRKAHVGTSKLNETMLPIIEANPPQSIKGKYIKIKYCTQLPNTQIPSFVFYANLPQYVKENYRRFLENKIRENWSMHGCPINIFIRQK
jgi:GTP-binding protein